MSRDLSKLLSTLGDEEKPVSHQLLRNLSDMTEPELAQFKAAWADFSSARRRALIQALVDLAEEHIEYHYNPIFAWTMDDLDPDIRVLSIDGLWEDKRAHFIPRLQQMMIYDEDVDVRAAAAMALGRYVYWAETKEITSRYAESVTEALWDVYHNPSEHVHVRRRALEGLGGSSHPGVPRIIESAHYDDDLFIKISALYAMGRTADVQWIPYLLPYLENETPQLRIEAVRALGQLEAAAAADPMIRMLDAESDMEVRLAILEALGQIGGKNAKQALEMATDSESEAEAEMAELALEHLYAGVNNLYELIDEVIGVEKEEDAPDEPGVWDNFYEDPLDAEIRRLIDEGEDRY